MTADRGAITDRELKRTPLHALHLALGARMVPFAGYEHLLQRRFEEAVEVFLRQQAAEGPSDGLSSALAAAYHRLAFQTQLPILVRFEDRLWRGSKRAMIEEMNFWIKEEVLFEVRHGAIIATCHCEGGDHLPEAISC